MRLSHSYWDIALQIAKYAVDSGPFTYIRHADEVLDRITEDSFLDHLYVARSAEDFETTLIAELQRSPEVVCLTASRGGGKTSAIRYAKRKLAQLSPETAFILWDIKRSWTQRVFQGLSPHRARERFKNALYRKLLNSLFAKQEQKIQLVAWLLSGAVEAGSDVEPEAIEDLDVESAMLISEAGCKGQTREARYDEICAYFEDKSSRFGRAFASIQDILRPSHLVHAAVHLGRAERVIVAVDNADRLPAQYQPAFMEELNDGQLALGPLGTVLVAIRLENIKGLQPRPGEGGDNLRFVTPNLENYPAVLVPSANRGHTQRVLRKRHEYARKLYENVLGELDARDHRGSGADADNLVHEAVVDEFLRNSIYNLANGSLRAVVGIYTAFVEYLVSLQRAGRIQVLRLVKRGEGEENHLHTLFFLWLRAKGSQYEIKLHDIHKSRSLNHRYIREPYKRVANLPHLLMTSVHNLTAPEPEFWNEEDYPTFSRVFENVSLLGFSMEQVRQAMQILCAKPGQQARILEFKNSEPRPKQMKPSSEDHLGLTRLGHELIAEIYSKVGYVWSRAIKSAGKELRGASKSYHDLSRAQRLAVIEDYLVRRSEVHLKLMSLLKKHWGKRYRYNWLREYRQRFAVNGQLQVERLLLSAEAFYFHGRSLRSNPFRYTYEGYRQLLYELRDGKAFHQLDLGLLQKPMER